MFPLLLILIFIRPFVSSLGYPYLNLIYSILLLGFLGIWILVKGVNLSKINPVRNPLILFILALAISLIFSSDIITSTKELYKYATGILLLCIGASLSDQEKDRVILCITLAGLVVSLLAIYQYFFGFQHLINYVAKKNISSPFVLDYISRRRPFFPFVTPNVLAGYLAMIIPLAFAPLEMSFYPSKILFLTGFIQKHRFWLILPLSFALLLTQSIGALLSIFLGLAIYIYLKGDLRRNSIYLGLLIMIIGLVLISRSFLQKLHTQPIFSAVMRLNYWQDTLGIIKAHPWTGVGLGNFNLAQSRYAHNSYLQVWAEMGILGIISFLWLIMVMLRQVLKNLKDSPAKKIIASLTSASAVFLMHNFVDFSFFLPEVSLIWWLILGMLVVCGE